MDSEIRHLRLLTAIADFGSVTRAAESLHLTQSALSHQLRGLEGRLGTPLFHRVGKKMVATPAGLDLIDSARRVLDIVSRTEDGIKRGVRAEAVPLRLSTECYTVYHWLPSLLPAFRRAHPNVEVRIDAAATSEPVKALLDGRLDLALMTTKVNDRRLASQPLFTDEMRVIVPAKHPLAGRGIVRAEDFAGETLFTYSSPEDSHVFQRVLVPAGVTPASVQRVPLTEAIVELVKAGLGIAVLTEWTAAPYVRAGGLRALPLTRKGFTREWRAVTLAGVAGRPWLRDFVDLLRTSAPMAKPGPRPVRSIRA